MSFSRSIIPLEGKLAIVTGAGIGIGLGVAEELARQGAAVILHYAHSAPGAIELAERIVAEGGRALAVQGDLSNVEACRRVIDQGTEFLGGLDVLVNNSGVTRTRPLLETPPELFDELFAINVRGAYFCTQQAVPHIRSRGGGAIVNMTSVQAYGGISDCSVYAATKSALIGPTQVLAMELAPMRIRVNAIGPGMVEVPRYYDRPEYSSDEGSWKVPWGRVGLPADIAKATAFIVSDAANFITGQTLYVDGGTTAKLALPAHPEAAPVAR